MGSRPIISPTSPAMTSATSRPTRSSGCAIMASRPISSASFASSAIAACDRRDDPASRSWRHRRLCPHPRRERHPRHPDRRADPDARPWRLPDFVVALRAAGYSFDTDEIVRMRDHGVNETYVSELRRSAMPTSPPRRSCGCASMASRPTSSAAPTERAAARPRSWSAADRRLISRRAAGSSARSCRAAP